jgi:sirohydrochlorin ferrochelatase
VSPTLLAAVHGTRSPDGQSTTQTLISRVRSVRPGLRVDLCFLDVLEPRLAPRLAALSGPVVVVPVLLSAGYHVREDIPSAAAARATVARHLGPDRVLSEILAARLAAAGGDVADTVALVASPSTRVSAARDLARAAGDLASVLGRPVQPLTVGATLPDSLAALPGRIGIATYLLSEGHFYDALRAAASETGAVAVAAPLGAHPAIAELIVARYDEALTPHPGQRPAHPGQRPDDLGLVAE